VNFEWDEDKSEHCFVQRGFDFAHAARAFFDPNRVVNADIRRSYGEERYQLMGLIEQRLFVVVYTLRPDAMRNMSARKANQREVKHYEDSTNEDQSSSPGLSGGGTH
jgi:uncharacterized protein